MTSVNISIVCRNIKWVQWAVIEGLCGNAWLTINVHLITRNTETFFCSHIHTHRHYSAEANQCMYLCLINILVSVCNSHSWLHPVKDPSWRAVMSVIYLHPSFFPASISVSPDAIPPSKVIFTRVSLFTPPNFNASPAAPFSLCLLSTPIWGWRGVFLPPFERENTKDSSVLFLFNMYRFHNII